MLRTCPTPNYLQGTKVFTGYKLIILNDAAMLSFVLMMVMLENNKWLAKDIVWSTGNWYKNSRKGWIGALAAVR